MNHNNIKWGAWIPTDSTMVSAIRFSATGKYIEKKFHYAEDATDAFANQSECFEEGATPLECWKPEEGNTYISLAAEILSERDCHSLHAITIGDCAIGNPQELRWAAEECDEPFDGVLDFIEFILETGEAQGVEWTDRDQVFDFLEMSWKSQLEFGDMHWGNVGIFEGRLVCIDFDAEHNSEAIFQGVLS